MSDLPEKRDVKSLTQSERTEIYWLVRFGKFKMNKVAYYYDVSQFVVSNILKGNLEFPPSKNHFEYSFTGRLENL